MQYNFEDCKQWRCFADILTLSSKIEYFSLQKFEYRKYQQTNVKQAKLITNQEIKDQNENENNFVLKILNVNILKLILRGNNQKSKSILFVTLNPKYINLQVFSIFFKTHQYSRHSYFSQISTMQQFNQEQNQVNYQNLVNKTTVKKEKTISNRLIRFNQMNEKENQFQRSNVNSISSIANKIALNNPNSNFSTNPLPNIIPNSEFKTVSRRDQETEVQDAEIKVCANHPDKQSQFVVKLDGEQTLTYCRKCATHIASQGFDVQKINQFNSKTLNQRSSNTNMRSPNLPLKFNQNSSNSPSLLTNISPNRTRHQMQKQSQQSFGQKKRIQLLEFAKELKQLRRQYANKSEYLSNICQSYETQKENVDKYYSELICYIEDMREMHLQDIQEQSINSVQLCQIEKGEIEQAVSEIDKMIYDIQNNIDNIVNEIDEDSYVECFAFYRQKEGIFSHRLQELGVDTKPCQVTEHQMLVQKVDSFKSFVNQLQGVNEVLQQNSHSSGQSGYNC